MQTPPVNEPTVNSQQRAPNRSLREADALHPVALSRDARASLSDFEIPTTSGFDEIIAPDSAPAISGIPDQPQTSTESSSSSSSATLDEDRPSISDATSALLGDVPPAERYIGMPGPLMPARRAMVDEGTSLDDDSTEEDRTAKPTQVTIHQNRGPRTGVLLPIKVAWDKMTDLIAVSVLS